jgi:hypothetical protein
MQGSVTGIQLCPSHHSGPVGQIFLFPAPVQTDVGTYSKPRKNMEEGIRLHLLQRLALTRWFLQWGWSSFVHGENVFLMSCQHISSLYISWSNFEYFFGLPSKDPSIWILCWKWELTAIRTTLLKKFESGTD